MEGDIAVEKTEHRFDIDLLRDFHGGIINK